MAKRTGGHRSFSDLATARGKLKEGKDGNGCSACASPGRDSASAYSAIVTRFSPELRRANEEAANQGRMMITQRATQAAKALVAMSVTGAIFAAAWALATWVSDKFSIVEMFVS